MENVVKKKIDLLSTPIWSVRDIATYIGKSKTTAYTIKDNVIADKGKSKFGTIYVYRDDVLEYLGTTAEKELKTLKVFVNEEELQERNL